MNPNAIELPSKSLIQGTVFSLLAGIGAGLLRDRLIMCSTPGDVKDDLGLPVAIFHMLSFSGVREDKRFFFKN